MYNGLCFSAIYQEKKDIVYIRWILTATTAPQQLFLMNVYCKLWICGWGGDCNLFLKYNLQCRQTHYRLDVFVSQFSLKKISLQLTKISTRTNKNYYLKQKNYFKRYKKNLTVCIDLSTRWSTLLYDFCLKNILKRRVVEWAWLW